MSAELKSQWNLDLDSVVLQAIMKLLQPLLQFFLMTKIALCSSLRDSTLSTLRKSLQDLTFGKKNQTSHCYYGEGAPACYG